MPLFRILHFFRNSLRLKKSRIFAQIYWQILKGYVRMWPKNLTIKIPKRFILGSKWGFKTILFCYLSSLWTSEPSDYLIASSPKTVGGADININVDFLYWAARNPRLNASMGNLYPGGSALAKKGTISGPNYEISPGFKVGLGIILDHDEAFLDFEYTRLGTSSSAKTFEEKENTLYPTFNINPAENPSPIFYSSPDWNLHFSKITVIIGRGGYIGEYTTFTPYFGLVNAFITQHYNINYKNLPEAEQFFRFTFKQNGVGLRFGNNGTLYTYYKKIAVGLTTDLAFSTLLTKFRVLQNTTYIDEVGGMPLTKLYFMNSFHAVMPTIDLLLGLKIEKPFCSNRYNGSLMIAWESQVWFLGNPFAATPLISLSLGQFSLSGLTLQSRFDF